MNKKFKVGEEVVCTWGTNKGKEFKISLLLKDGSYSCRSLDDSDEKYYRYDDNSLRGK
jgi:uncharacterized protein YodC (DUF2158 family)